MKFLSAGKEPKQRPKEKAKTKPEKLILPKCSVQAGVKVSSVHKRPVPDKKENAVKKAVVAPVRNEVLVKEATCESSTPSWASDHNYNAVKPEQTAALWPSLLCKCKWVRCLLKQPATSGRPPHFSGCWAGRSRPRPPPHRRESRYCPSVFETPNSVTQQSCVSCFSA
nr:death inducer-obliterator 1 [Molossus molossus]